MGFTIDRDKGKEVEPFDTQEARSPIGPNWLWTIRIAALMCFVPLLIASELSRLFFTPHPLQAILVGILLSLYVLIPCLLGGRMQRTALGAALWRPDCFGLPLRCICVFL